MAILTILLLLIPLITLYVRIPSAFVTDSEALKFLVQVVSLTVVYPILGIAGFRVYVGRQVRRAQKRSTQVLLKMGMAHNTFVYGLAALFFVEVHWLKLKESFERLFFSSELFIVSDVLLLLPFLAPFLVFRIVTGKMVMKFRGLETTLAAELLQQLRTVGVFLLPQLLYLNIYRTIVTDIPFVSDWLNSHPMFGFVVAGTLLFMLFALSPYFIGLLYSRTRLEHFPNADLLIPHLEKLSRRTGIEFGRAYVWLTGQRKVANAAVSGLFRKQRTVFFTDYLLRSLTTPEIMGVLAHEIGHARFRHLFFNFLLAIMSGVFVIWGIVLLYPLIESQEEVGIAVVGLEIIYIVVFFGSFAKRFERQADLYAAHATGEPLLLAGALEKLAGVSQASKLRSSISHPSIRSRVLRLQEMTPRIRELEGEVRKARRSNAIIAAVMLAAFAGTLYAIEYLPL